MPSPRLFRSPRSSRAGNLFGTTRTRQPGPLGRVPWLAIGDDLGRGLVLVPFAERAETRRSQLRRAGLKSCGRLARSCAMITQRPTIGSLRKSGICSYSEYESRQYADGSRQSQELGLFPTCLHQSCIHAHEIVLRNLQLLRFLFTAYCPLPTAYYRHACHMMSSNSGEGTVVSIAPS